MRDPLSWSIPCGRLFGVAIRVHWLYPVVALGFILRVAYQKSSESGAYLFPDGAWIDVTILTLIAFVSVVLHEFGHCFGARYVEGDAQEVLIWPLGGLAFVEVPHTPRANFIATAAGPAVNLFLCLGSALLLLVVSDQALLQPIWNPIAYVLREGRDQLVPLKTWSGESLRFSSYSLPVLVSWFFFVNWVLSLFNLILIGFPMDSGRMLQSALWPWLGYRQATVIVVIAGFVTATIVGLYAVVQQEVLALCLAFFIFSACKQQWIVLETGGEDSLFGYDFSQGYTSLERDHPPAAPPRPRQNWWQRWQQRRASRKMQKETETRERDERRMDSLLEKISSQGIGALSEEEKRFMKQYSNRYRRS